MFLFLLSLAGMLVMSDIPAEAGESPEKNSPVFIEPIQQTKTYPTAFYWETYGG